MTDSSSIEELGKLKNITVAVITSTIGRATLKDTIESVLAQTYPCVHYVFVHGEEYYESSNAVLDQYPMVKRVYLPVNTGANAYGMAGVFAASPFLVLEDILCYLDDDNVWENNHVESLVHLMNDNSLGWAYSLRKIFDKPNNRTIEDDCQSLGAWPVVGYVDGTNHLVDNSCYAVTRALALKTSTILFTQTDTTIGNCIKVMLNLDVQV